MCFVLHPPQFSEHVGPCMPKPQAFCPVSENTGEPLMADQETLTPPPNFLLPYTVKEEDHEAKILTHSGSFISEEAANSLHVL